MEEEKISISDLAQKNNIDVYDLFDKDELLRKIAALLESLSYK